MPGGDQPKIPLIKMGLYQFTLFLFDKNGAILKYLNKKIYDWESIHIK